MKSTLHKTLTAFTLAAITATAEKDRRHTNAGSPQGGSPPSAPTSQPPSERQFIERSERLAVVLNVPVERLRSVLGSLSPGRP